MKNKTVRVVLMLAAALVLLPELTKAQLVGYYPSVFQQGDNWIGNPLSNSLNTLSTIISNPPTGTRVWLWVPTNGAYSTESKFTNGVWSVDYALPPGQGALLSAPSSFTNTFVGIILTPDGSLFTGAEFKPPPVFTGSNGVYLLSCKSPLALSGTDTNLTYPVFTYILGRGPLLGESFTRLNASNQTYQITTFTSGAWNNGIPALNIGEAGLFNIGPVAIPEFRITAIVREGNNIRITWMTAAGTTNELQAGPGGNGGSYRTNNLVPIFTVTNTVGTVTNYLDLGGATNAPSRFYRVRLVP